MLSLTKVGEAFGLVPYEATLCEANFIGPNVGAITEFVVHRQNGLMVNTNDVEAITAEIEWSILHPEECRKMIFQLQKIIHQEITPMIMARNLMNEYSLLINGTIG